MGAYKRLEIRLNGEQILVDTGKNHSRTHYEPTQVTRV